MRQLAHFPLAIRPTGTPSLSGVVSTMAGLTVEETDRNGLRLRRFREHPGRGVFCRAAAPQERDEGSGGIPVLRMIDAALSRPSTAA